MFAYDHFVYSLFPLASNPILEKSLFLASFIFNPLPFIVLVAVTAYLIRKKFNKTEMIEFVYAMVISVVLVWVLKYVFSVSRPDSPFQVFGPSFPSAHATVATSYFLMLLHFLKKDKERFRRILHYFFCILSIVFVGVSRLYFGVHWLSDIIAGYILGAFVVYYVLKYGKYIKWINS